MRSILAFVFDSKIFLQITEKIKQIKITSHKVSLYRVLQIFFRHMEKDNIVERATSMAFNFVLSIFPAIIFIFTLLPYIPIENLQSTIMFSLKSLLPNSVYNGAATAIYDILHIQHGGLMSFGFFFAIFTATNGIMSMITAFNKCYKTSEKRGYFQKIYRALIIVFLLLIVVFITIFFAVYTRQYLNKIHFSKEILYYTILCFKYVLFFAVFYIGISVIYYIAPAVSSRWKFFSPGSLIAALLCMLFTLGFAYYVNSFDSYNKLYGSIGAFIGVMLWFYAISIMLLIGFEINASLDLAKREAIKMAKGEPLED